MPRVKSVFVGKFFQISTLTLHSGERHWNSMLYKAPFTQRELRGGVRMLGIMGNIFEETKELLSHFLVLFRPTLTFHAHR